jgi:hypothetical protein
VLLTVVAAAAHMSGVGHAGPPALVSGSVTVDVAGLAPIGDARNPSAIVVQAPETFAVTVGFVATVGSPLTFTRDSVVTLSVAAGGVALGALRTIVVPAGASTATLSGFSLSPAGNGVVLGAAVTGGSKDAKALQAGTSAAFDVLLQADRSDSTAPAFVTTDRGATGCVPTEVAPYCADVSLPIGTTHGYLVSVGTCDSVTCPDARTGRRVVQLLAGFPDRSGDAPAATIVFKCDKSKCKGGGVSSYTPLVQLEATGALVPAPSCAAKGVVTSAEQYCVDYVQSKRDGAGDLHMYVLFAVDVRGSCC